MTLQGQSVLEYRETYIKMDFSLRLCPARLGAGCECVSAHCGHSGIHADRVSLSKIFKNAHIRGKDGAEPLNWLLSICLKVTRVSCSHFNGSSTVKSNFKRGRKVQSHHTFATCTDGIFVHNPQDSDLLYLFQISLVILRNWNP